jgi:hypothetical protein
VQDRLDWIRRRLVPGGYNALRVWDDRVDGWRFATAGQVPDAVGSTVGVGSTTLVDGADERSAVHLLVRGSTAG